MIHTINKALKLLPKIDPQASALLQPLENKSLTIVITDLNYTISLNIADNILSADNIPSLNTLSGKLSYITELMFNKNLQELIITENLRYDGSLGDLNIFNDFFNALDIDISYKISKHTGPIFADIVAKPLKKASEYIKTSRQETIVDIKDYLTEERRTLISTNEVNIFFREIQEIKQSVDRLEAKIQLLKGLY